MLLPYLLEQGPSLGGMLRLMTAKKGAGAPDLPGPELRAELPPRPAGLVRDYLKLVGGRPEAWGDALPPHLFPQWGFPLITRVMVGLPFDLRRGVNAGFSWRSRRPLPAGERLSVSARLTGLSQDERKALITVSLTTGTESAPGALASEMVIYVPLGQGGQRREREQLLVPAGGARIAERALAAGLGGDFALLTGDLNPIHWLPPYARMAGFGGVILHGFCTAAVAQEALISELFGGDASKLAAAEGRFTRPLRLPAQVGVFVEGDGLYVGEAAGEPACFVGSFVRG